VAATEGMIVDREDSHWTALLTALLGLFYVFLGATALGLAGVLGIVGGLLVLTLVVSTGNLRRSAVLVLLLVAALPFAVLTWWSVVTPVIAVMLLVTGVPAIAPRRQPAASRSRRRDDPAA
jgi:hypothetical protein